MSGGANLASEVVATVVAFAESTSGLVVAIPEAGSVFVVEAVQGLQRRRRTQTQATDSELTIRGRARIRARKQDAAMPYQRLEKVRRASLLKPTSPPRQRRQTTGFTTYTTTPPSTAPRRSERIRLRNPRATTVSVVTVLAPRPVRASKMRRVPARGATSAASNAPIAIRRSARIQERGLKLSNGNKEKVVKKPAVKKANGSKKKNKGASVSWILVVEIVML